MPSSSSTSSVGKRQVDSHVNSSPHTSPIFKHPAGVKLFLNGYSWLITVQAVVTGLVLIILFMRLPFLEPFQTKQMHKSLHDALMEAYDAWNNLLVFTFTAIVTAFSASFLKESLEDGLVEQAKKYFYVFACFVSIDSVLQVSSLQRENPSAISIYFELPRCAFALFGVAFTHSTVTQK